MDRYKKISAYIMLLLLVACVPAKEFEQVSQQYDNAHTANRQLVAENKDLSTKVDELNGDILVLNRRCDNLEDDTVRWAQRYHRLNSNYATTKQINDDLMSELQKALSGNSQETQSLLKQLQDYQNALQAREDALTSAEAELLAKRNELDGAIANLTSAEQEIAARNARIAEMENLLNEKDKLMSELRERVMKALEGYQGNRA